MYWEKEQKQRQDRWQSLKSQKKNEVLEMVADELIKKS